MTLLGCHSRAGGNPDKNKDSRKAGQPILSLRGHFAWLDSRLRGNDDGASK
jgi:hypothetical protein